MFAFSGMRHQRKTNIMRNNWVTFPKSITFDSVSNPTYGYDGNRSSAATASTGPSRPADTQRNLLVTFNRQVTLTEIYYKATGSCGGSGNSSSWAFINVNEVTVLGLPGQDGGGFWRGGTSVSVDSDDLTKRPASASVHPYIYSGQDDDNANSNIAFYELETYAII